MAAPKQYEHDHLDRPDFDLLARAVILSLAFHLLAFGGYKVNQRYHWLDSLHLPAWMQHIQQKLAFIKPQVQAPPPPGQPELVFVEVNPAVAAPEPPKKSKYYSSRSSRAANTDANQETETPKITGEQAFVPRTENVAPAKPQPLQPTPAPQPEESVQEEKPKPAQTPGDLAFAKPQLKPRESDGQSESEKPKPRPRTLAEAQARQPANQIAGQQMKLEGGVRARAISSLDVTATPFGAYDAAVIAAIQARWYALIDNQPLTRATGKVVLTFHLNYDGTITEMRVVETTVSGLLTAMCQRAVLDPAPYGVWPSDMRRMVAANFRDVSFTFYYY